MLATLRYVLITALRDKLIAALIVALAACGGAALFIASSALEEQNQFGLAFAGESSRLVLALGLITFIAFHTRRMYETREIEAILSRPISRITFVFAYFCAYAAVALFLALVTSAMIGAVFIANPLGMMQWAASLALESLILVAMALFCAMALESATASVMAALGFYLLGRMAASFRFIVENGRGTVESDSANHVMNAIITAVAAVMPRMDLFGPTRWLIYGPGGSWGVGELLVQTLIYVPLLLLATMRDLQIKRF
jgi:ABC-type transport system involved in multi-copper enzyme maturation permease subunit